MSVLGVRFVAGGVLPCHWGGLWQGGRVLRALFGSTGCLPLIGRALKRHDPRAPQPSLHQQTSSLIPLPFCHARVHATTKDVWRKADPAGTLLDLLQMRRRLGAAGLEVLEARSYRPLGAFGGGLSASEALSGRDSLNGPRTLETPDPTPPLGYPTQKTAQLDAPEGQAVRWACLLVEVPFEPLEALPDSVWRLRWGPLTKTSNSMFGGFLSVRGVVCDSGSGGSALGVARRGKRNRATLHHPLKHTRQKPNRAAVEAARPRLDDAPSGWGSRERCYLVQRTRLFWAHDFTTCAGG